MVRKQRWRIISDGLDWIIGARDEHVQLVTSLMSWLANTLDEIKVRKPGRESCGVNIARICSIHMFGHLRRN